MKTCPVCRKPPDLKANGCGVWGCSDCGIHASTLKAWDALPRVAPNAEALVNRVIDDAYEEERWVHSGDGGNLAPAVLEKSRGALLRACVVDAAEVAALRVQRDALEAELAALKQHLVEDSEIVSDSIEEEFDAIATERDALAAKVKELEDYPLTGSLAAKFAAERDEARVQRDEAVAALAAVKNPAPFPSERFVATVIAMMPEWFNDADATDSFRALTKALRDAAVDLPRDTPATIIERATGVPEAPIPWDAEDARLADTPATPPVVGDADALLESLVDIVRDGHPHPAQTQEYAAVRARMRPPITAEALWGALANAGAGLPTLRIAGERIKFALVTMDTVRAALAALGGGK